MRWLQCEEGVETGIWTAGIEGRYIEFDGACGVWHTGTLVGVISGPKLDSLLVRGRELLRLRHEGNERDSKGAVDSDEATRCYQNPAYTSRGMDLFVCIKVTIGSMR